MTGTVLTLDGIEARARQDCLGVYGALHTNTDDAVPEKTGTLVLLGPQNPGFWSLFRASREFGDGRDDPLDRWSRRVIAVMAADLDAAALFPFGGSPYRPFIAWALRSGRAWQSPVGMLVHDRAGLMVSYRGALAVPGRLELPELPPCPCETCPGQPCRTACPVDALNDSGYDLAACHAYLDTGPGQDCMGRGCAARRACPVSQSHGREAAQSAFHMKAFHP